MKKKLYVITRFLEIQLKIVTLLRWGLTGHCVRSRLQMFSINARVFFKYIYTILSVFFSFIVICFYFTNISTYTCPKSVLMYDFKADSVTKNLLHYCPRAFFVNQLFSKMRKIENVKSFWSRVLIFQDSRFLFTAKLLRIDMKNLRFNRYTKSRLYLGTTNMRD